MNIDPMSSINKKIPESDRLYTRIIAGQINVGLIASMENNVLNPSSNEHIRAIIYKRENSKVEKNYEDFPCRKCDMKKYILFRIQTRSLDEGADVYYLCENCGNKRH
jgi:DNA-directed RNA polymerase subunit M/transcription elongation factor TFIIS